MEVTRAELRYCFQILEARLFGQQSPQRPQQLLRRAGQPLFVRFSGKTFGNKFQIILTNFIVFHQKTKLEVAFALGVVSEKIW